jgi:hypothetical protein
VNFASSQHAILQTARNLLGNPACMRRTATANNTLCPPAPAPTPRRPRHRTATPARDPSDRPLPSRHPSPRPFRPPATFPPSQHAILQTARYLPVIPALNWRSNLAPPVGTCTDPRRPTQPYRHPNLQPAPTTTNNTPDPAAPEPTHRATAPPQTDSNARFSTPHSSPANAPTPSPKARRNTHHTAPHGAEPRPPPGPSPAP